MDQYLPILIMGLLAFAFTVFSLVSSAMLAPRKKPSAAKLAPYECGIVPSVEPPQRFPVRFYLVSMIFIIFDIEIVFLYPWAVVFHQIATFGLVEVIVFAAVVFVSFLYLISNGALDLGTAEDVATGHAEPDLGVDHHADQRGAPDAGRGGLRHGVRGPPAQLPDRPDRGPRQVGAPQQRVARHLRSGVLRHRDDVGGGGRLRHQPASGWRCSAPRRARPT